MKQIQPRFEPWLYATKSVEITTVTYLQSILSCLTLYWSCIDSARVVCIVFS
jgi:hypothetical protein